MKNFSIHRMGCLLNLDLTRNSRTYIQNFLGFFLGFLFMNFVGFYSIFKSYGYKPAWLENDISAICGLLFMTEVLLSFYCISHSFTFLKDKSRRISYLLLPATHLEKFLARILTYTLGQLIQSFIAFLLAYLVLSVFVSMSCGVGIISMYSMLFTHLFLPFSNLFGDIFVHGVFSWAAFMDTYSVFSLYLFFFSLYMLASMIFRSQPFIWMSVCCVVSLVILGLFFGSQYPWQTGLVHILRNDYLMSVLYMIVSVVLMYSSYRLFKRKGVSR